MSVASDALEGTPEWFQRLVTPMIFTLVIAVPLILGWTELESRIGAVEQSISQLIDRDISEINEALAVLVKKGEGTQDAVQRYEVLQGRMDERQAAMAEKIDRIIRALEAPQ